jgi:hypothetical protein
MGGKPLTSASGLHWDTDNSRLGVGTASPAYTLDVTGTARFTGAITGNVTGNVSGNAAFATNATHANKANTVAFTDRDTNNETDYIAFVSGHTAGDYALYTDQNLTYNPSTNQIGANISGSAGSATNAGYAANAGGVAFTARDNDNVTDYIAFVDTATAGDKALFTDSNLTYNPSTNQIGANISGSAGSATNAGYAANAGGVAFTARDNDNVTDYIAFVDTATAGDKALFTDSNLTYNPSTNHINANVPYANAAGNISSGNATMPGYIKHTGDTNTYFGFPGNDTYVVATNGGERVRVASDGNVGIGTNAPAYKLDVNGTVNTGALTATSATVPNDGDFVMGGKPLKPATGLHWDRTNSRLGVGTGAPAYTLDVTGTARFTGAITGNVTGNVSGNAAFANKANTPSEIIPIIRHVCGC